MQFFNIDVDGIDVLEQTAMIYCILRQGSSELFVKLKINVTFLLWSHPGSKVEIEIKQLCPLYQESFSNHGNVRMLPE